MDVMDVIITRRSIRAYMNKPVAYKLLCEILNTAKYAPSSGNIQNWKFILVDNQAAKDGIAECCLDQEWMAAASHYIVICNDTTNVKRMYHSRGEKLYSIQNCAAVASNIMLAAHGQGLATCWVGAFDEDKLKAILKIPDDIAPEIIITIGYAAEDAPETPRYPLEEITYFSEWGNRAKATGLFPLKENVETAKKGLFGFVAGIKNRIFRKKS